MKAGRRRELPYVFSPGKKLVQVVVKMKDTPRAFATVLELLGRRVNLIETVTYTKGDRAIFSGFAEALFPDESSKGLKDLIKVHRGHRLHGDRKRQSAGSRVTTTANSWSTRIPPRLRRLRSPSGGGEAKGARATQASTTEAARSFVRRYR